MPFPQIAHVTQKQNSENGLYGTKACVFIDKQSISQYFSELLQYFSATIEKYYNMTEDFSLKALVLGTITMSASAETKSS